MPKIIMDPISDMLIRLKNAQKAGHASVQVSHSKFKYEIAKVLERLGIVGEIEKKGKRVHRILEIGLNCEPSRPKIKEVKLLSSPGRRIYIKCKNLNPDKTEQGFLLISTSKGVMSGREAKKTGLGGQLIAKIYSNV